MGFRHEQTSCKYTGLIFKGTQKRVLAANLSTKGRFLFKTEEKLFGSPVSNVKDEMPAFMCGRDSHILSRTCATSDPAGIDKNQTIFAAKSVGIKATAKLARVWNRNLLSLKIGIFCAQAARLAQDIFDWHRNSDCRTIRSATIFFQNRTGLLLYGGVRNVSRGNFRQQFERIQASPFDRDEGAELPQGQGERFCESFEAWLRWVTLATLNAPQNRMVFLQLFREFSQGEPFRLTDIF